EAGGRPAAPRRVVERAAPNHARRRGERAPWICLLPLAVLALAVRAPLPGVSVQVVQAPGVGLLLADRTRAYPLALALAPAEVTQFVRLVSKVIPRCGARPATILPLGLVGQADFLAALLAEPVTELLGVVPADVDHGVIVALHKAVVLPVVLRA